MNVLKTTCVFRLKSLDRHGQNVLYKARCCIRDDQQVELVDYNPSGTYAPVASHEAIRILFADASSHNLIVEKGDVSNSYLYGKIDYPVYIEQQTNTSGEEEMPGHFCMLLKVDVRH